MLADGDVIISPEGAQPMLDAVTDRIRAEETVTVETDGRISRTSDCISRLP